MSGWLGFSCGVLGVWWNVSFNVANVRLEQQQRFGDQLGCPKIDALPFGHVHHRGVRLENQLRYCHCDCQKTEPFSRVTTESGEGMPYCLVPKRACESCGKISKCRIRSTAQRCDIFSVNYNFRMPDSEHFFHGASSGSYGSGPWTGGSSSVSLQTFWLGNYLVIKNQHACKRKTGIGIEVVRDVFDDGKQMDSW